MKNEIWGPAVSCRFQGWALRGLEIHPWMHLPGGVTSSLALGSLAGPLRGAGVGASLTKRTALLVALGGGCV